LGARTGQTEGCAPTFDGRLGRPGERGTAVLARVGGSLVATILQILRYSGMGREAMDGKKLWGLCKTYGVR